MNENFEMAELLLPDIDKDTEYYEKLYPPRNLSEGVRVTRIAPSPTGYLHLGVLFMALINRITADSTKGIFYTRIEDTDKKREIEGGIDDIINGINKFGIKIDEGFVSPTQQIGSYGPYKQSERAAIYQCYAKSLIRQGLAYPCFCTAEDLSEVRAVQESQKIRTGYHGQWAKHRNITVQQAKDLIAQGKPFVVRLKSPGNEENKVFFDDGIKGKIEMPENDEDFVILKSDGIPTYHFAHVIDDHLMHTTHVIRGDEWISSVPKHLQLFKLLGFKAPKYIHVAPILKLDNGGKRKISKRKDPEAAVSFFAKQGFEPESIIEYLMTIAASDFEDWRRANQNEDYRNYKFNIKKMSLSGALFDWNKLCDVSKNIICKFNSDTVTEKLLSWAREFDYAFYTVLAEDKGFSKRIFSIDRDCAKPRKDLVKWNEAKDYCSYFFDELFVPCYEIPENIEKSDAAKILRSYSSVYDPNDERQEWFEKIKSICPPLGFSADNKEYKNNPALYKGHPGDASTIIRIAITGRKNTPDLCSIMHAIGKDTCLNRINQMADYLEK